MDGSFFYLIKNGQDEMKEKIIYNMATMPPRIKALEESIARILPQCDIINIYLNDFKSIPDFLKHPKIKIFKSQDHLGDLGDVGKFFKCSSWKNAYIFTVDDKLLYPSNYTERMIEVVEKYKREAVISAHGRIFFDRPCKTYYYDAKEFRGCLMGFQEDKFVHELGTGAMAFHTDTLPKVDLSIFKTINMTDIWFSIFLQKRKIPIMNPARPERWIWISHLHDDSYSIHNYCNKNDKYQTEIINTIKWNINTVDI
jgi:hypothetical protein